MLLAVTPFGSMTQISKCHEYSSYLGAHSKITCCLIGIFLAILQGYGKTQCRRQGDYDYIS